MIKTCKNCLIEKDIESFTKNRTQKDGFEKLCKVCRAYKKKSIYHSNPEERKKYIDRNKIWMKNNRPKINLWRKNKVSSLRFEILKSYGDKCSCCGESEKRFLTIDHINGGGKEHRAKFNNTAYAVYKDIINGKFDKNLYRILCMNCNFAIRFGDKCPHKDNILIGNFGSDT